MMEWVVVVVVVVVVSGVTEAGVIPMAHETDVASTLVRDLEAGVVEVDGVVMGTVEEEEAVVVVDTAVMAALVERATYLSPTKTGRDRHRPI